jgi:diguanylate cyclase
MSEDTSTKKTKEIVRTLIPFLSKKRIPITPQNFRIWFEYFFDKKDEIRKQLDELLEKGAVFTRKLNQDLYRKFFIRDIQKESNEQLQKEIQVADDVTKRAGELILNTIKDILKSSEHSSEFAHKLENYAGDVKKANRLDEVTTVLSSLLRDTHELESKHGKIQKKLEKSSVDLESLHVQLTETKKEALRDALTGIYNRRFFDAEMQRQLARVNKEGAVCSLIMLDIDNFKRFNDDYGHIIGDKLLKTVTGEMKAATRENDMVCRYGGEEFGVICPDIKLKKALEIAERIRRMISEIEFTVRGNLVYVFVSGGVSLLNETDTIKSAVHRADEAMYTAKRSGKNNIKSEDEIKARA